jgi:hypothetical protein
VSCSNAVPIALTPHPHVPQPPTRLTTSHDLPLHWSHRPCICTRQSPCHVRTVPAHTTQTQSTCDRLRVSTTTSPSCVLPNTRVVTLAECQFVSLSDVSRALLQVLLHIVAEPSNTSPRRSVCLPITSDMEQPSPAHDQASGSRAQWFFCSLSTQSSRRGISLGMLRHFHNILRQLRHRYSSNASSYDQHPQKRNSKDIQTDYEARLGSCKASPARS